MKPRICICCGEPMAEGKNALSRDPNVCASCSSMADGMMEKGLPDNSEALTPELELAAKPKPVAPLPPQPAEPAEPSQEIVVEWKAGRLLKHE